MGVRVYTSGDTLDVTGIDTVHWYGTAAGGGGGGANCQSEVQIHDLHVHRKTIPSHCCFEIASPETA